MQKRKPEASVSNSCSWHGCHSALSPTTLSLVPTWPLCGCSPLLLLQDPQAPSPPLTPSITTEKGETDGFLSSSTSPGQKCTLPQESRFLRLVPNIDCLILEQLCHQKAHEMVLPPRSKEEPTLKTECRSPEPSPLL